MSDLPRQTAPPPSLAVLQPTPADEGHRPPGGTRRGEGGKDCVRYLFRLDGRRIPTHCLGTDRGVVAVDKIREMCRSGAAMRN